MQGNYLLIWTVSLVSISVVFPAFSGGWGVKIDGWFAENFDNQSAYVRMESIARNYGFPYTDKLRKGDGTGENCTNNQDLQGTVYGEFRCPIKGFSVESTYCCGDPGNQYCCTCELKEFVYLARYQIRLPNTPG